MFSYATDVSKVGEATSTLADSERIQINLHKSEKCPEQVKCNSTRPKKVSTWRRNNCINTEKESSSKGRKKVMM